MGWEGHVEVHGWMWDWVDGVRRYDWTYDWYTTTITFVRDFLKHPLPTTLHPDVRNSHFTYNPELANGKIDMSTTKVVGFPVHTNISPAPASAYGGPIFFAVICDTVALVA